MREASQTVHHTQEQLLRQQEENHQLIRQAENRERTAELERYQAVEAERQKWEQREEWLQHQVELLQQQLESAYSRQLTDEADRAHVGFSPFGPAADKRRSSPLPRVREEPPETPAETGETGDVLNTSALATALLAQQLPPLSTFSGETTGNADGADAGQRRVEDWLEQFEMVATMCKWDEAAKLANLATRLRGQAFTFYRSCSSQQRTRYSTLVAELKKRFTPVRIKSVDSSRFHERKQGTGESVDTYAQALRVLFRRAYPAAVRGSSEAEEMGESVLTYQFVSGLRAEIKRKIAGMEGDFQELLVKARFEEAKLRDLAEPTTRDPAHRKLPHQKDSNEKDRSAPHLPNKEMDNLPKGGEKRCYHCNGTGHFAKNCPMRRRALPSESRGHTKRVSALTSTQQRIATLRNKLEEEELKASLENEKTTMRVLLAQGKQPKIVLGPTLTTTVCVEGQPVTALLDTGSPVSIVSLEVFLQVLKKQRPTGQTADQWAEAVKQRLQSADISLHHYGGDQLRLIWQTTTEIERKGNTHQVTILVQKNAPLDFLLGTDLMETLGFQLVESAAPSTSVTILQDGINTESGRANGNSQLTNELPFCLQTSAGSATSESTPLTVRVLAAVKVPARHGRTVRVKAEIPERSWKPQP